MGSKSARVFEVGPRDGLQSEAKILKVQQKTELVLKLIESGLTDIEIGSFVRRERIPQLADTEQVAALLAKSPLRQRARFWAFIPNETGLDSAIDAGLDGASFFVAASETFCHKNVNRSQKELLDSLAPLIKKARQHKLKNRVYVSTSFHCPYEGFVDVKTVAALVARLVDKGASQIALSDTTGWANPRSVGKLLDRVLARHPAKLFALHFHDTRGQALANALTGLDYGITTFDSSIGGAGGCPYAPGATGNLSTEDLVFLLQGMGLDKSIDLTKLGAAGLFAEKALEKKLPSRVLQTMRTPT
jgi:hydroxymethylglutaryl-CoA lyase